MARPKRHNHGSTRKCARSSALRKLSLAVVATGAGYMLFEAQWLRLRRLSLDLPGIPASLDGLKLLHLSDLHAGAPGPAARAIAKLVDASRRAEPDIVLFTGDMVDKKKDLRPHLDLLGEIEARYGKFAVLGNHDHGLRKTVVQDLVERLTGRTGELDQVDQTPGEIEQTVNLNRELLAAADIRLLENECQLVDAGGRQVQICGIDDFQYGYDDLEATSAQVDHQAQLRILLSHSPNAVYSVNNGDFQLLLAGHTHGGQICIPKPGGKILLSTSGAKYADGLYRRPNLTMHVSRGVGTTFLPFRFFSRPEATLLELKA